MKRPIAPELFESEIRFTEVYKENLDKPKAIREALCLRERLANFAPIRESDLFAGVLKEGVLGFGLEESTGGGAGFGFYPEPDQKEEDIKNADIDPEIKEKMLAAIAYWRENAVTIQGWREMKGYPGTFGWFAGGNPRLAGVYLNYDKLLRMGLPGLIEEVSIKKAQSEKETSFYDGLEMALDFFKEVCLMYAEQAKTLAASEEKEKRRKELEEMSESLVRITREKPQGLRDAIQLFYLYALISGVVNYGRMDVFLGDFYVNDIDSGTLTEDEALSMLKSLWKMIADRNIVFNGRVIIGGKGRRNEANADRFALAAMEASRLVVETEPQLSLRFYEGQNPALMKKALDVIGEGRIYPMLYNDDVNISAVSNAFGIPMEEAKQYLPYGCGEYAIDHKSLSAPNCVLLTLEVLDLTLHNGYDTWKKETIGLQTGEADDYKTFDELFAAYKKQVEYFTESLAARHKFEYVAERRLASYLYVSALFDNCIEEGVSVVDEGERYLGGIMESFGNTNTGDSLAAIKKLVYDEKAFTLKELVHMLDVNFEGYEKERKLLLDVPKYGNDDDKTDAIVAEVNAHIGKACMEAGKRAGLHHFLVVNINNEGNVMYGRYIDASADGRKHGAPLANGNTPTAGMDKKGITAFLNSITKIDPNLHAGYVHNIKCTRQLVTKERAKFEALLRAYFANGGTQAMITALNRGDLENAMKEPEKYSNLIVRVGGFSARFVTLARDLQQDILNRTLY